MCSQNSDEYLAANQRAQDAEGKLKETVALWVDR